MSPTYQAASLPAEAVARLLLTLEQIPAIVWTTDRELRFTSSRGSGLAGLGLKQDQVVGMSLAEYLADAPELLAQTSGVHRRALAGESGEYEHAFGDRYFRVHIEPLHRSESAPHGEPSLTNGHQQIVGCIGVATDITEQRRTQLALRASEEQLRTITENLPNQILEVARDGTILYINRASWGLTIEQVVGTSVYDWQSEDEVESARENLRLAFEEGRSTEADTYVDYEGVRHWYCVQVSPHRVQGEINSAVIVTHEITARKVAEKALQNSELHLRQLGENLDQVLFLANSKKNEIYYMSPAFERVWGISLDALFANPDVWHEAIHPDDRPLVPREGIPDSAPKHPVYEYRIVRPDGTMRWIRSRISQIFNDRGEPFRVAGLVEDVTESKVAAERLAATEQRLRDSNQRFEEVAENIPGLLFQTQGHAHGELTAVPYVSRQVERYMGHSPEAVRANPHLLIQAIHPDDLPGYIETALRATANCEPFESEFRVVNKQQREAWLHVKSQGRCLENGQILYSGIAVDITERVDAEKNLQAITDNLERLVQARTVELEKANRQLEREIAERKRTEAALRENEQRFRELAENITEIFWLSDPAKKQMLYISPAYETVFQRTCQSLYDSPKSFLDQVHPEDVDRVRESLVRQVEGEYEQTYRIVRADGELRWIRTRAFPVLDEHGTVHRVAGLTEDITDTVRDQEAIREKNQLLDGLMSNLPLIVWRVDEQGVLQHAEGKGLDRFDPRDNMVGQNIIDAFPQYADQFRRAIGGETVRYLAEESQHSHWCLETFLTHDVVRGSGAIGFSIDVTERQLAQRELEQSHERFNRLVNSQFIGIIIVDALGKVIEANDAFLDMVGSAREEHDLTGLRLEDWVAAKSRDRYEQNFQQLRSQGTCAPVDLQLMRRDGGKLPVLAGTTMLDAVGERCMCVVLDVSERRKVERRLRREERLLRRSLDLHERERKLFAYDIHDSFVQDVVSAKMILEAHAHQFQNLVCEEAQPEAWENVQKMLDLLGRAIDDGRRVVSELRPIIIDEQGVIGAIDYLVNDMRLRYDLRVEFDHAVTFDRLPPLLENTLFRVVQEALSNVQRHAETKRAIVTLLQTGEQLTISIVDEGVGFKRSEVPDTRFGLQGIIERAKMFGGKARVRSKPGRGTRVVARFPLDGIARRRKSGQTFSG